MASLSKKQCTKKKRKEGIRCKEVLKNGRKCDKLLLGKDELAIYCERCNEPTKFLVLLREALEKGYLTKEVIFRSVPALSTKTSFASEQEVRNDRGDKMGFKEMIEKGEMILPKDISEKQKKLLLEVFTDVTICREKGKPLQVVAARCEPVVCRSFVFIHDEVDRDLVESTVDIYPSEGDRVGSVFADNFSFPGEGTSYQQGPNPQVIIKRAGKKEKGLNLLNIYLNPRRTEVEKSTEQKVEERKKEAVEKGVFEKAATIAQELGREVVSPRLPFSLKFRNRNLKIVTDSPPVSCVRIYAKREGKILKRLIFTGHQCSGIEVYKPGKWEKLLDPLYEQALVHKRKKEKTKREMREQELVEDFNL